MRNWTPRLLARVLVFSFFALTVATIAPRTADAQPELTPTGSFPTPPATPECFLRNTLPNDVVRAGIPDTLMGVIFCRTLVQNGEYIYWRTNQITDDEHIGIAGLLELDIRQAVDVFSPGVTYYEGGIVMCLRGRGNMIYLNANQAPRHAEIVGTYTVDEFPGFTCLTLFEPGTLVLVQPPRPTPRPTRTPRGR